jgi:DNA-binding beta-propeller fold protein YncE
MTTNAEYMSVCHVRRRVIAHNNTQFVITHPNKVKKHACNGYTEEKEENGNNGVDGVVGNSGSDGDVNNDEGRNVSRMPLLHVYIMDSSQNALNYELLFHEEKLLYTVSYTPVQYGSLTIEVTLDGQHLKESPFSVQVLPLSFMENVLSNDVIENMLFPFLSMRDLFFLHLANTRWKSLVEAYVYKTIDNNKRDWILSHLISFLPCFNEDRNMILSAVKIDGLLLRYATEAFKGDREIVFAAVGQNKRALEYVLEPLRNDNDLIFLAQSPQFQFKKRFGTRGTGNGEINFPYFVTCDRLGNIFVSDCLNHRVHQFDSNGNWNRYIGGKGFYKGQFNQPMGISFNSKNHLIVADSMRHRVQVFDESLQFIKSFGSEGEGIGQFRYPNGTAVDANDNIFVNDYGNHRVQVFDSNGIWKQTIGSQGLANGQFNQPWDIAVCKTSQRIYLSDMSNHRIQVFSPDWDFLFKFGSYGTENGQFNEPCGLVTSKCGQYLLVCDTNNRRIQVFNSSSGAFIKSFAPKGVFAGELNNPQAICISPSGQIIFSMISSSGRHSIQIYEQ